MTVFKEFYEVVGEEAFARAQAHKAAQKRAFDEQWKIVHALGAEGFRPGNGGGVKSLLFTKANPLPDGFRKIGTDRGRIEAQPARNTKAGKRTATELAKAPKVEDWGAFANTFGWKGRSPMSTGIGGRGIIHFCAGVAIGFPKERFFLQFPRELKDGWKPLDGIVLVRESDMLRAIENHNAIVVLNEPSKEAVA